MRLIEGIVVSLYATVFFLFGGIVANRFEVHEPTCSELDDIVLVPVDPYDQDIDNIQVPENCMVLTASWQNDGPPFAVARCYQ